MQYSVTKRDGPARIGELTIEQNKITTPNIFFVNTERFSAPDYAETILPKEIEKESNIVSTEDDFEKAIANLIIIKYASQLLNQHKNFVNYIIKLRKNIGYQKAIYLPGVGDPTNIALLAYLGIDIFDSTSAIIAARNNNLFFETGAIKKDELQEIYCNCPICNKLKIPKELSYEDILYHNYYTIYSELRKVRNAIANQNLRNLVENRIRADPNSTAILKNLDRNHQKYLEKRAPVASKSKIIATSKESINRPEIKRFQDRVINRYKKPESTKILLLLPCSAKKPYFLSKSHKFFRNTLLSIKNPNVVHELIITSPLGLVPRELECTFPAANYDIPVTGIWDDYEKEMITNLLSQYLKINKYEKIIAHLPKELIDFIKPLIKNVKVTCIGNPTSNNSLEKLKETLDESIDAYEKLTYQIRAKEEILSLAQYQFGEKDAVELLKNSTIKGRYPYRKIFENGKQLGMITQERGLISLTLEGAQKINYYYVEIYDDFELKGSVFAPGIKNADKKIRIGDEVRVKSKKKIIAIGVAQMNGEEMIESTHGEAVKVRHKI
jgi:archaeosine synthase